MAVPDTHLLLAVRRLTLKSMSSTASRRTAAVHEVDPLPISRQAKRGSSAPSSASGSSPSGRAG